MVTVPVVMIMNPEDVRGYRVQHSVFGPVYGVSGST